MGVELAVHCGCVRSEVLVESCGRFRSRFSCCLYILGVQIKGSS